MSLTKVQLGLLVVFLFVVCTFGVPLEINYLTISHLNGPSFNTDQVLSSIGIMVTGLGLFIALAGLGIAVLAIVGFSELRAMVNRRVDEGLRKLEENLRRRSLLDNKEDEQLADLAERVEPELLHEEWPPDWDADMPEIPEAPNNGDLPRAGSSEVKIGATDSQNHPTIHTGPSEEQAPVPKGNQTELGDTQGTGAKPSNTSEYQERKESKDGHD